jgi:hypothetical protein
VGNSHTDRKCRDERNKNVICTTTNQGYKKNKPTPTHTLKMQKLADTNTAGTLYN